MANRGSVLAGVGVGAGLSYLLDPSRGGRRRASIRDTVAHTAALTRRAAGATGRDVLHRTYGTAAWLRSLVRHEAVDDDVLVERVRAKLGRIVSHPHAVAVSASDGVVTVKGPILTREAEHLVRAIARVPGVRQIVDQLERHAQAGNVPALQGGRTPGGDRIDVMQENWAPATRTLAGIAGAALMTAGAARRGARGSIEMLLGAGLATRAVTNVPLNQLLGIGSHRRAVDVQKTISIGAPVEQVFAFWSSYENFPRFMSRVLEVKPNERLSQRSHWQVAGPAGVPVSFDAEITRMIPNQVIAWKTVPGATVAHSGIVRFDPDAGGGTRVHIRMSYDPPAGWLGLGVAAAFGVDPKKSMDADLVRMKTLIETGRPPHDAAAPATQ